MSLAGRRTFSRWYLRRFFSNSVGLMGLALSSGAEAVGYRKSVDVNCEGLVLKDPEVVSSPDFCSWSSLKRGK